jgi:hypothetical protein
MERKERKEKRDELVGSILCFSCDSIYKVNADEQRKGGRFLEIWRIRHFF